MCIKAKIQTAPETPSTGRMMPPGSGPESGAFESVELQRGTGEQIDSSGRELMLEDAVMSGWFTECESYGMREVCQARRAAFY
jgi:hypothetical protein